MPQKIVVFDLDETLGHFSPFGMFLDCLEEVSGDQKQQPSLWPQPTFNALLDLFPEFVRPNMLAILRYLVRRKRTACCSKVVLYTNNQGPRSWAEQLVEYFRQKVGLTRGRLFDQIIAAFKVRGQRVELCRTTSSKTHGDFLRCTQLPADTEICFLDDLFHPAMANEHIYYVHVHPYENDVSPEEMVRRLVASAVGQQWMQQHRLTPSTLAQRFHTCFAKFRYTPLRKTTTDHRRDVDMGHQILTHLKRFFSQRRSVGTRNRRQRGGGSSNKLGSCNHTLRVRRHHRR